MILERGRHIIDRYKRALFAQHRSKMTLKTELRLLSMGSNEKVMVDFGVIPSAAEWRSMFQSHADGTRYGSFHGVHTSPDNVGGMEMNVYNLEKRG